MGFVHLIFLVLLGSASSRERKEVALTINKLSAFVGESGLQIRCRPNGKTIVNPVWMVIEFAGFQSKRPMVYLFKKDGKNVLEWGEEFNVTRLQSHIKATGHLKGDQSFLQLDFSHVVCGDGGRYTCSYGGFDKMGKLRKFSTSGDFVTKTIDGGPPKVSVNGKVVKSYESFKVSPGEKIHLVCEGDVGKPRIPIFWLVNEISKPARLLGEKEGVKQGLLEIPEDNPCTFRSTVHLFYEMGKTMTVLTCKLAFRTESIFLRP